MAAQRRQETSAMRETGQRPVCCDDSIAVVPGPTETAVPLSTLTEDEQLFQRSVYRFADAEIRPLVREMDEHASVPRTLIDALFQLGVMGIEIPDELGGAAA